MPIETFLQWMKPASCKLLQNANGVKGNKTRWLYCVECPQYSIRFDLHGYLCDCLSGRGQDNKNTVANVITVLLTTMPVEVNNPVSRYLTEWGICRGLMTSSGHVHFVHYVALSVAPDGRRMRFWSTFHVQSLVAKAISLSWFQQ